uniref:Uncharacterized protein n=1 Tax=Arundo donax TaxID=35708 RepID=A0A0A9C406_ARUDO
MSMTSNTHVQNPSSAPAAQPCFLNCLTQLILLRKQALQRAN